ncbi:MAG: hypothetical protein IV104_04375 [Acidovorax sp.]|nr:hypothetical protein [Acidovorax sp.]
MKNKTPQEHPKSIEQSLEKFKELRRNLGPDASVDHKRYLDEMISMGEKALDVAVPHSRMVHERVSPFSLSWRRIGKRLLLVAVVFVVTFTVYAFLDWV